MVVTVAGQRIKQGTKTSQQRCSPAVQMPMYSGGDATAAGLEPGRRPSENPVSWKLGFGHRVRAEEPTLFCGVGVHASR